MQAPTYREIPLRNRKGDVVAHARVDAVAYDFLTQWRWHLAHGYATRTVYLGGGAAGAKYMTVEMHRLVFGLGVGGPDIDHANRNRLDNRLENLRLLTRAQQPQNQPSRGASPYRGVTWSKEREQWSATVTVAKKRHHLGYFDDELFAARVAADFRRKHMPYAVETLEPLRSAERRALSRRSRRTRSSSRYRGVTWSKHAKKWMATGNADGQREHLGYFSNESEASVAVEAWHAAR